MDIDKQLTEIQTVLKEIIAMLHAEKEDNWIRAFEKMYRKINMAISGEIDKANAIAYVRDTFDLIYRGNGSFSDYCIWRHDFDQCKVLNQKLEDLIDKLITLTQ